MALRYRCPDADCRKTFPWDSKDEAPTCCPHCGYSYREEEEGVISMPNILSARTKSIEGVARATMDGSEARMEAAAVAMGGTKEDYSALKITNLNDGRQSEFATKDVANEVTKVMDAAPGLTGFQSNGAVFAQSTTQGAYARAGANQAVKLSNLHQQHKQVVSAAGVRR